MASRTLDVRLNATDNMSPAFQKAGGAAKTLGESLENLGKGTAGSGIQSLTQYVQQFDAEIRTVGQAMTTFGVGITGAIAIGVRSFAGLESAMANVASIAGDADIAGMTNEIRELAVELGVAPTGLADGLYDLISSGIDAADAMDVLKVSATAAKAGLTDTATASRAITAVLNAYSLSADRAGDVSDVLFQTVNEGVITFEGLANNLSNVIPLAASLGVGIEEVGAAFKELTLQGFSAATSETGIAAVMRAAINPTEELTEAVREYGYANVEAMVQAEGLSGLLRVLEEASGGSSAALMELLGTSEATTAALALLKNGADGFADSANGMFLSMQDGALTAEVAARQMDTFAGSMDRLQAAASVLSGVVGEAFAGFLTVGIDAATGAISGLTGVIQSLPGPLETALAAMTGLAGGAAVLSGGLLLMLPRIVETRAALQTLGGLRGVFGMLSGAVSPLGLALTGVAAGALLVYENMRRGAEGAKNYASSVEALTKTIEELKLAGEGGRATFLAGLQSQVDASVAMLDEAKDGALTFYDDLNLAAQGIDPTQYSVLLAGDFNRAIALADDANIQIGQALSNPNIDADAYSAEVQRLLSTITVTAEGSNIDEVMQQILDIDLTKFRQGVEDTRSDLEKLGDVTMDGLLSSIDRLGDGEAMLATINDRATELTATLDDLRIDGDIELASQLGKINDLMQEGAESSDAYLDAQDRISGALADGKINYESVAAEITRLNEEYARTGDIEAYEAGMISLSQNLSNYTEGSRNSAEATAALNAEFISSALAIAGYDNALSQLNMTGMTTLTTLDGATYAVGQFAEEGIRAGEAFDNTFRILVSNVQQYGQGIQSATDWMEDLVAVNDEGWSKVGQLVTEQRISWEQGEAAVDAYNRTLEANYDIQQNLLAVQALQAPYIADNVAATQAWVAELAQMPAEVQRTTLAFMDLQTVQTAQEIITLGNSEAFRNMNEEGRSAFEAVIQGALQTNPLLFDVLSTMGIISGTPLDFDVDYSALEGAGSAIEQLTTQVGYLVDTLREIYGLPPIAPEVDMSGVEAATSPGGPLGLLKDMIQGLRDEPVDVPVNVQLGDGTGGAAYMGPSEVAALLGLPESVDVPVNIIPGSAAVGDGTGGAGNWRDMLGIPPTVDVPASITPDTSAIDTALAGYENQTIAVDIVIGTNELDSGLMNWGLGGGDGSGGRAGYEGKQVSVDIVLGDNELDTIDEGTYGPITIDVEANTASLAASLATIGLSNAGGPALEIPVTVNKDAFWQGMAELDGVMANRPAINVSVTAETGTAVTALNNVTSAADAVPTSVSTTATALTSGAVSALNDVTAAADAVPTSVSTTATALTSGAVGALNDVAAAAANIPSSVSTTAYVNTVYTTSYRTVGSPGGGIYMQHGGIPSYATGGVLFRAAEGNRPEIAHFAGGGTALLPRDGLYMAPPMTYISPHNSSASYGGDTYQETIELHIHGNVYGIDDLADAMEGALARRRRGYGQAVTA